MTTLTEKKSLFVQLDSIYNKIESINLEQLQTNMLACGYSEAEINELLTSITMPQSLLDNILPGLQADIDDK